MAAEKLLQGTPVTGPHRGEEARIGVRSRACLGTGRCPSQMTVGPCATAGPVRACTFRSVGRLGPRSGHGAFSSSSPTTTWPFGPGSVNQRRTAPADFPARSSSRSPGTALARATG